MHREPAAATAVRPAAVAQGGEEVEQVANAQVAVVVGPRGVEGQAAQTASSAHGGSLTANSAKGTAFATLAPRAQAGDTSRAVAAAACNSIRSRASTPLPTAFTPHSLPLATPVDTHDATRRQGQAKTARRGEVSVDVGVEGVRWAAMPTDPDPNPGPRPLPQSPVACRTVVTIECGIVQIVRSPSALAPGMSHAIAPAMRPIGAAARHPSASTSISRKSVAGAAIGPRDEGRERGGVGGTGGERVARAGRGVTDVRWLKGGTICITASSSSSTAGPPFPFHPPPPLPCPKYRRRCVGARRTGWKHR